MMDKLLTLKVLSTYSIAVFAAGWIIPLAALMLLRRRGEDSKELRAVAMVWGGATAVGLVSFALGFAGLEVFTLLVYSLMFLVYYAGGCVLIIVGFMRIRTPSVGWPLILCGVLALSAMAACVYTSAISRPKTVVTSRQSGNQYRGGDEHSSRVIPQR